MSGFCRYPTTPLGDLEVPVRLFPLPDPSKCEGDRIGILSKTGDLRMYRTLPISGASVWVEDDRDPGTFFYPRPPDECIGWFWTSEPTALKWEKGSYEAVKGAKPIVRWKTVGEYAGEYVIEPRWIALGGRGGIALDDESFMLGYVAVDYWSDHDSLAAAQREAARHARDRRTGVRGVMGVRDASRGVPDASG